LESLAWLESSADLNVFLRHVGQALREHHLERDRRDESLVEQVLRGAGEDLPAARGSRMKLGRTASGRYLQVVYVPDEHGKGVFVITSYELHGKAKKAFSPAAKREAEMIERRFPPGWDEDRVREVLAHYEGQSEDEQFAEIEAAREAEGITLMAIPPDLVPEVLALLARNESA
jgi:hypothetical protein